MLTSRDRILTTHVGSLARNERLSELLIKREAGETYDTSEFDAEMDVQRERARAGASFGPTDGDAATAIYQVLSTELPPVEFLGYEALTAPARILAMVAAARRRREAVAGDEVEVILDRTPAYAESPHVPADNAKCQTGLVRYTSSHCGPSCARLAASASCSHPSQASMKPRGNRRLTKSPREGILP